MSEPIFFDMASRFPWPGPYYGSGFRIGDRAAAYIMVLRWRTLFPDGRLLVLDDLSYPECVSAGEFSAEWMFRDLADEVRMLGPGEAVDRPGPFNLYDRPLWEFWRATRYSGPSLHPRIVPPESAMAEADLFVRHHSELEGSFVVVQPLFDAGYNTHRNREWDWWVTLMNGLRDFGVPIVVAVQADYTWIPRDGLEECVFTCDAALSPMSVLALARKSSLFVGGETGLTLWAPIMQVPTCGLICSYANTYWWDTAPIGFGRPALTLPLERTPEEHTNAIREFVEEHNLLDRKHAAVPMGR